MGAYNESAPMMRGIVIWLSVLLCMYRINVYVYNKKDRKRTGNW